MLSFFSVPILCCYVGFIYDAFSSFKQRYSCQLKTMNPPDIEVGYMADATLKTHDNITFNVTCEEQEVSIVSL